MQGMTKSKGKSPRVRAMKYAERRYKSDALSFANIARSNGKVKIAVNRGNMPQKIAMKNTNPAWSESWASVWILERHHRQPTMREMAIHCTNRSQLKNSWRRSLSPRMKSIENCWVHVVLHSLFSEMANFNSSLVDSNANNFVLSCGASSWLNVFTKYCPEKHSKFSARDRSAITKHLSTRGRGFPPTSKSEILQFAQFSSVSLMTKNWSIRFANFVLEIQRLSCYAITQRT